MTRLFLTNRSNSVPTRMMSLKSVFVKWRQIRNWEKLLLFKFGKFRVNSCGENPKNLMTVLTLNRKSGVNFLIIFLPLTRLRTQKFPGRRRKIRV